MTSARWLQSPHSLLERKYLFLQAVSGVKEFRQKIKRGDLSLEEIDRRRSFVYGIYARGMNDMESWTSRLLNKRCGQITDFSRLSFPSPDY